MTRRARSLAALTLGMLLEAWPLVAAADPGPGPPAAGDKEEQAGRQRLAKKLLKQAQKLLQQALALEGPQHDRYNEAVNLFRQAIELDPASAEAHLGLGTGLYHTAKFQDAIEALRRSVDLAPELEAFYLLAMVHFDLSEWVETEKVVQRALAHYPDNPHLLYLLANVYMEQSLHEKALSVAREAHRHHPENFPILTTMASIYCALGDGPNARAFFALARRAVDAAMSGTDRSGQRQFSTVFYNMATCMEKLGDEAAAFDMYREALLFNPTCHLSNYSVGRILLEKDKYSDAVAHLRVAVQNNPDDPPVRLAFGNALQRAGDLPGALAQFRAAYLLAASATALAKIGEASFGAGAYGDAERAYRQVLDLFPGEASPRIAASLAQVQIATKSYPEALATLAAGLPRWPADADLHRVALALARTALKDGASSVGEASYRKLLEVAPDKVGALVGLGRFLRQAGRVGEARGVLEHACRVAPRGRSAGLELAALEAAEGDPARAAAGLEELLGGVADGRSLWPLRAQLVTLWLGLGRFEEARRQLPRLLEEIGSASPPAEPPSPPGALVPALLTIHALLLAREGAWEDARRQFERAAGDTAAGRAAGLGLAVARAREARLDDARQLARRALTGAAPGSFAEAAGRANLGLLEWLAGRLPDSRAQLEAALGRAPDWAAGHWALASMALADRDYATAVAHLATARKSCGTPALLPLLAPAPDRLLQVSAGVRNAAAAGFCDRVAADSVAASLGRAAQALEAVQSLPEGEPRRRDELHQARELLDLAAALPQTAAQATALLFLRGTSRLLAGDPAPAREDLEKVVASADASRALIAAARANLGVALYQLGQFEAARESFEAARQALGPAGPPTLNLAIYHHEHGEDGRRAIELYQAYLPVAGARQGQIADWVARLRLVFP